MIIADRTIQEVMGENEKFFAAALAAHKTSGLPWSEYVERRLKSRERKIIDRIFSEARRIGYVMPETSASEEADCETVEWHVITRPRNRQPETPCLLCERECARQEWRGGPWKKNADGLEVKKCWEKPRGGENGLG